MKLSDLNIQTQRVVEPPRIVIYGQPKVGKSTLASQAHTPFMADIEAGSKNIDIARVEGISTLDDFKNIVMALMQDEHEYKTFVIDSLDWLERLVQAQVAKDHGKTGIEDIGFGKGYTYAVEKFASILAALDRLRTEKGMVIAFLAHSHIKAYQDPMGDNYDRFTLKLHNKIEALITEWADVIAYATKKVYTVKREKGFGQEDVKAKGGSERVLVLDDTPSALAGNRYGLPKEILFTQTTGWNELMTAIKGDN